MIRDEERNTGAETGPNPGPAPGHRVAAAEWRQSRAATYDTGRRARDQVGRDAAPIPTPGAVGRSEWRQAGRAARPDMAMAGSAGHVSPGTLGSLDLRATDRFPRRG